MAKYDPEFRELWLSTLEGDEYKQAKEYLRREYSDGPKFCCLGVACDLYMKQFQKGQWEETIPNNTTANMSSFTMTPNLGERDSIYDGDLPPEVLETLGLYVSHEVRCITMNDAEGLSFKEIAKTIRTWTPNKRIEDEESNS